MKFEVNKCLYPHSICQPVYILFSNILLSKIWFSTKFLIKQGVTYMSLSYFILTFFFFFLYDAMIDSLNFLKMLNMWRVTPIDIDSTPSSKKKWIIRSHCVKSVQIRSYFWSIFSSIPTECVFSPNRRKCGPEITTYLDTFHAVSTTSKSARFHWI